jgi:hypothetical protein
MPLYNWIKCTEEGEMEYVCKEPGEAREQDLYDAWARIFDDYIERFGLNDLYVRMLKKQQEKAILQLDYVETRDRFKLTLIEIAEMDLKKMMHNGGSKTGIQETLVVLSKWVGYRLNPKEITVSEYFNIRKRYGEENKQKRHK